MIGRLIDWLVDKQDNFLSKEHTITIAFTMATLECLQESIQTDIIQEENGEKIVAIEYLILSMMKNNTFPWDRKFLETYQVIALYLDVHFNRFRGEWAFVEVRTSQKINVFYSL